MNARTLKNLAEHLGLEFEGDPNHSLSGVASPEQAGENDLIYVESARHLQRVVRSKARSVITTPELRISGKTMIFSERPKLSFAQAALWLTPEQKASGVHPTAVVAPS